MAIPVSMYRAPVGAKNLIPACADITCKRNVQVTDIISEKNVQGMDITKERNVQGIDLTSERNVQEIDSCL